MLNITGKRIAHASATWSRIADGSLEGELVVCLVPKVAETSFPYSSKTNKESSSESLFPGSLGTILVCRKRKG